jgi:hypothetical protein
LIAEQEIIIHGQNGRRIPLDRYVGQLEQPKSILLYGPSVGLSVLAGVVAIAALRQVSVKSVTILELRSAKAPHLFGLELEPHTAW